MSRTPARAAKDAERARMEYRRSWLIVVAFGAVVITLVNWLFGTTEEPRAGVAWLVAAVLSAAMVAHGITSRRNQHVLPETKADGIYYQGLLFTFGSLVAALIAFGSQSAGTASTGTVIINFGIALLTTIVGLAGRVLFSMYQLGIGEISGTAVRELDEAAGEMKDKIRRAGERMEDLARHLDESTKSIYETTKTVAGTVESLQGCCRAVVQTTERIVDDVASLGTHVEGAASAAAGLREPVDEVARNIRASCNALARLDKSVAPAATALGGLARASDDAKGTLSEAVVATSGRLAGFGDRARRLDQALEDLRGGIARASAGLASLSRIGGNLEGADQTIVRIREAGSNLLTSLDEAAQKVQGAVSGLETAIPPDAGRANGLEGLGSAAADATRELVDVARAGRALSEKFAESGSLWSEATTLQDRILALQEVWEDVATGTEDVATAVQSVRQQRIPWHRRAVERVGRVWNRSRGGAG